MCVDSSKLSAAGGKPPPDGERRPKKRGIRERLHRYIALGAIYELRSRSPEDYKRLFSLCNDHGYEGETDREGLICSVVRELAEADKKRSKDPGERKCSSRTNA